MANFSQLAKEAGTIGKAVVRAIRTPAIPEAGARTISTLMEEGKLRPPSITERHPGVEFKGDPSFRLATRSTEQQVKTVEDWVREKKRAILAFVQSDPDMPRDVAKQLVSHRHDIDKSNYLAGRATEPVYANLTTNPVEQAALMWDYAVVADDYAQARREGYDTILKADNNGKPLRIPLSKWESHLKKLDAAVQADPEIRAALTARTQLWKEIFQDMVNEGAIMAERALKDYTPMRHLTGVVSGLAEATGDESFLRRLTALRKRETAGGLRETNLAVLEHDVIRKYLQWKAQRRLFNQLMADPTINLTEQFKYGDPLPSNLTRYLPQKGQIGYMPQPNDEAFLAGAAEGFKQDKYVSGGFVIPKALKTALEEIHPVDTAAEDIWRSAGRRAARWLTVYNPKNLSLNIGSDLITALLGLPGEKAQPLGILRWYGKTARGVVKAALLNEKYEVSVNGQIYDVMDLARQEGLGGATFMSQVADHTGDIPAHLERLLPEGAVSHNVVREGAVNTRQGAELAPRIAAGLEALERTGDIKEFGRIGREITLDYGGGSPLASRLPMWKLIAPFIKYTGLATRRVLALATTPGSQARTWTALIGVPMAAMMWNTKNDAFKAVEDALPEYERNGLHIILSHPSRPDEPILDRNGKPIVLRFRWLVTEEMMKQAGLGNVVSRASRVTDKRDKPSRFAKETIKSVGGNMGSMLTMPSLALDILSDTDRFGKHRDIGEKLTRVIPALRIAAEGATYTKDYGIAEGVKRTAEEMAGVSFASVSRKGKTTVDATLQERTREHREAKAAYTMAVKNGLPPTQVENLRKKMLSAAEELKRYVNVVRQQRKLNSEEVNTVRSHYLEE